MLYPLSYEGVAPVRAAPESLRQQPGCTPHPPVTSVYAHRRVTEYRHSDEARTPGSGGKQIAREMGLAPAIARDSLAHRFHGSAARTRGVRPDTP